MKRSVLLCACLALTVCITASAGPTGISISSQRHSIMGNADAGLGDDMPYIITGTAPLSASAAVSPDAWPYSYAAAGNFAVSAEAGGTDMYSFGAAAKSIYEFNPNTSSLKMTFTGFGQTGHGGFEAGASFSFFDLTTSLELDAMEWIPASYDSFAINYINAFSVDPTHSYRLVLEAFAGPGESGDYASQLAVDFTNPTPGAFLLGSIGVGAVGWMRRRKQI